MSTSRTLASRTFLLLDRDGRNVDVTADLKSHSRQAPYFSITSQNGCNHDVIVASAPKEVLKDIKALVDLHLCDFQGKPMHAVENAIYHLNKAEFEKARQALGAGFPVEEMYKVHAQVAALIDGRAEIDPVREAVSERIRLAKAVLTAKEVAAQEMKDGSSMFMPRQEAYIVAIKRYQAAKERRDYKSILKSGIPAPERAAFVKAFEKGKLFDEVKSLERYAPEGIVEAIKAQLAPKCMREAVEDFVDRMCAPKWAAAAEKGRAILEKPGFRTEARPDPAVDPKTFDGFLATNGVKFEARMVGPSKHPTFRNSLEWVCTLTGAMCSMTMPYFLGSAHGSTPPSAATFLETLQMDISSIEGHNCDSWMEELGFTENVASFRAGQKAYEQIIENRAELQNVLGDAYPAFMTEVGDNPPFSKSHSFEQSTPKM